MIDSHKADHYSKFTQVHQYTPSKINEISHHEDFVIPYPGVPNSLDHPADSEVPIKSESNKGSLPDENSCDTPLSNLFNDDSFVDPFFGY